VTCYADSSFIVASRVSRDTFHPQALRFFAAHEEDIWLWSPWHRVEVFNTLRQLTRASSALRSLRQHDARALIHRLESDVRLGFFLHIEADWRDVLRTASEISVGNAFAMSCPAADLLHVAYAKEVATDLFVSFDNDQVALADACGLRAINPNARIARA
jgi:predicted nucleic acid-binding protein